jgi:hypothetical protein
MEKIWNLFSGNSNILKFLLSPVRFTKCLGVRVPLRPPEKKALPKSFMKFMFSTVYRLTLKVSIYSRPSDIPVQKAEERERNSEEQCTKSGQMASE